MKTAENKTPHNFKNRDWTQYIHTMPMSDVSKKKRKKTTSP